ncbi:MAG: hypothetical protein RR348_03075, partial [Clostridia bacterium]
MQNLKSYLGVTLTENDNVLNLPQWQQVLTTIRLNIIQKHIDNGVIFVGTDNIFVDDTVTIDKGVTIYPNTTLR